MDSFPGGYSLNHHPGSSGAIYLNSPKLTPRTRKRMAPFSGAMSMFVFGEEVFFFRSSDEMMRCEFSRKIH